MAGHRRRIGTGGVLTCGGSGRGFGGHIAGDLLCRGGFLVDLAFRTSQGMSVHGIERAIEAALAPEAAGAAETTQSTAQVAAETAARTAAQESGICRSGQCHG